MSWLPFGYPRRFKMKETASPRSIIDGDPVDGNFLGMFMPGFAYWTTPNNLQTVEAAMAANEIEPIDPGPVSYIT